MGKDAPSLPEVADFLETAQEQGPREHAVACLMALNGLQAERICQARASDVGWEEDGTATLSVPLTAAARKTTPVPLAPRTAQALSAHLEGRVVGPLIVTDNGSPLQPMEAIHIARRIARAAGLGYRFDRF